MWSDWTLFFLCFWIDLLQDDTLNLLTAHYRADRQNLIAYEWMLNQPQRSTDGQRKLMLWELKLDILQVDSNSNQWTPEQ